MEKEKKDRKQERERKIMKKFKQGKIPSKGIRKQH